MKRITLYVQNLKCSGCEKSITDQISKMEGIRNVIVSSEEDLISLDYEKNENLEFVKNKLLQMGYPSIDNNNSLINKTKSYLSCMIGKVKLRTE